VLVNLAAPFSEWVVHSTLLTTNYFPLGLAFGFILVVVGVNPLLKLVNGGSGLNAGELTVIYAMLLAAVSVPTYGITGYVISVAASPYYFATSENGWAEILQPHIPSWAVPASGDAITWFFEGLPVGEQIPWSVWIFPLFWWGTVMAATLVLCICLITIFRKQWVEKERLNFPLVEVPMAMVEGAGEGRVLPDFMRHRLFWIGFAIAAGKIAWNAIGYANPQWPLIPAIRLSLAQTKIFPGLWTNLSIPLLGITYFVNADVIFSVWVFSLFNLAEVTVFNRTGFTIGASEIYSVSPAALAWQGFGAFAAIVAGGIWVAREHLRDVFRKAIYGDPEVNDDAEILPYRAAVLGGIGSVIYILLWLMALGISLHVAALLLYAVITLYLGLTRIVIEGGLVFVRGPLLPQGFVWHMLGPVNLSVRSMTGLALSYGWACDPIATFMPFGANAAKILSDRRCSRPTYLVAVGSALLVSLLVSFWISLKLAYGTGGFNFGEWVFSQGGQVPYDTVITKMQSGAGVVSGYYTFLGIGVLATLGMTYLRHRFPWWRLHPIGFSIASVGQVRWTVLSLFVAWLAKVMLVRMGGLMLYNRAKPFFIGLVVGHFLAAGLSFFLDMIWFQGQGHSLYM